MWFLTFIFVYLAGVSIFGTRFLFQNFGSVSIDEIMFQLSVPIKGANESLVQTGVTQILIYPLGVAMLAALIVYLAKPFRFHPKVTKKKYLHIYLYPIFVVLTLVGSTIITCHKLGVINEHYKISEYFELQNTESTFIADNLVDAKQVGLEFPEQKRNLIYIYLESMEASFMDKNSGGVEKTNLIPELTKIASSNLNFSNTEKLGGAYVPATTGFTIGGIIAQTAGLPLKLNMEDINQYGDLGYTSMFKGAYTLGDILEKNGYTNEFMCGSDAVFGGRKTWFTTHGNYIIKDFTTAAADGAMPEGYYHFWGFEDSKLIPYAKAELTRLAAEEKPFNFTMLTVNTHAPDGDPENACLPLTGSDQYRSILGCSSRQVSELVDWIKKQDFYENTTIIITGDHLTMAENYNESVADFYNDRRVYNAFINAVPEVDETIFKNRQFTTLDMYPTTLAALGVKIDGEKLNLGTNLFSGVPTLLERYGASSYDFDTAESDDSNTEVDPRSAFEIIDEGFSQKSTFYNNKFIYGL